MKQLYIDYNPFCVRVALTEDSKLIEFYVEHATKCGLVGNIYKGKVENVLSGMKAAFVNIGLERNGFLYCGESLVDTKKLSDQPKLPNLNVSAGDVIMCQVVKDQFGQKGARLTTDITIPGFYLVMLPRSNFLGISRKIEDESRREYLESLAKSICPENMGFIIRSAAGKASDEDIIEEAKNLYEVWKNIQQDYNRAQDKTVIFEEATLLERSIRDTLSEDVDSVIINDKNVLEHLKGQFENVNFELYSGERNIMTHFKLSKKINKLADRRVNMDNGAYIVIDKTEALTVIDVNTGKFVGTSDLEDTVYKTNMEAASCIARQLRTRNISGIVVIDFIDMELQEHREAVVEELNLRLKKDRLKTSAVSMTSLGLVELTRKKTRLPVDNFMLQPCDSCMGGFVVSTEQLTFLLRDKLMDFCADHKGNDVLVLINKEVFDSVFYSKIMLKEVKTIWKDRKIYFKEDNSIKRDKCNLKVVKDERDLMGDEKLLNYSI